MNGKFACIQGGSHCLKSGSRGYIKAGCSTVAIVMSPPELSATAALKATAMATTAPIPAASVLRHRPAHYASSSSTVPPCTTSLNFFGVIFNTPDYPFVDMCNHCYDHIFIVPCCILDHDLRVETDQVIVLPRLFLDPRPSNS